VRGAVGDFSVFFTVLIIFSFVQLVHLVYYLSFGWWWPRLWWACQVWRSEYRRYQQFAEEA
jgi:hypothetical protein